MTPGGKNFNDFPKSISTGHRITKHKRLTHFDEMPGVGGRFARVGGWVSPT